MQLTEQQVLDRLRGLVGYDKTQTQLAAELGVSATFVSAVLSGKRPPSKIMLDAVKVEKRAAYYHVE